METLSKIRELGNSAAVIIPKEKMKQANLEVGDKVRVVILPQKTLGQILREGKPFKKSADELKQLVKRELKWE